MKGRKPSTSRPNSAHTPTGPKTSDAGTGTSPVSGMMPIRASLPQHSQQHMVSSVGTSVTSFANHTPIVVGIGSGQGLPPGMVPVSAGQPVTSGGTVVWSPLSFPTATSASASVTSSMRPTVSSSGPFPMTTGMRHSLRMPNVNAGLMSGGHVRPVGGPPGKLPLPPSTSSGGYSSVRHVRTPTPAVPVISARMSGVGTPTSGQGPRTTAARLPTATAASFSMAAKSAPLGPSSAGNVPSVGGDVEVIAITRPSSVPGMTSHVGTSTLSSSPLAGGKPTDVTSAVPLSGEHCFPSRHVVSRLSSSRCGEWLSRYQKKSLTFFRKLSGQRLNK